MYSALRSGTGSREPLEGQRELGVLLPNLGRVAVEILGHALEDVAEPRHAMVRLFGKIGAAEKRALIFGRQEHGQRPAAVALRDELLRDLINLIQVGALFSIDLDVDEQLVHQCRNRGVFERLVRHDMAPVTSRITHRQQNGLVVPPCERKRFLAPRIPIDGVFRVLQQIRARFQAKAIALHLADPS